MVTHRPIRFPWPDPALSPNKRRDRRSLTGIRDVAREIGFYLVKDAGISFPHNRTLELHILICPPDNRKRDDDNIYSSFKSYRDGMFTALEMNDNKIRRTVLEYGDVEEKGALYVTLSLLEKQNDKTIA